MSLIARTLSVGLAAGVAVLLWLDVEARFEFGDAIACRSEVVRRDEILFGERIIHGREAHCVVVQGARVCDCALLREDLLVERGLERRELRPAAARHRRGGNVHLGGHRENRHYRD